MQSCSRPLSLRCHNTIIRNFLWLALITGMSLNVSAQSGGGVDSMGTGGRHTISGRIYFPSGRRSDVRVKIKLQSLNSYELSVFSDANGTFSFKGLDPGSYTVVVDAGADYEVAKEPISIETEPGNSRRGLTLPPITRLYTVDISLRLKQESYVKAGVVNAAIAAIPEPARGLYLKALAAAEVGDTTKAIAYLKAALASVPEFALALNEL